MMLQYTGDRLITFEKMTGMTGIFTGNELHLVRTYAADGVKTPFIERLFHLGIFLSNARSVLRSGLEFPGQAVPHALHIDSTTCCPLNCPQCYKGTAGDTHLPLEVFRRLIDEAAAMHVFQIAIGGGEPLSHPALAEMVATAAATEMSVTLTTSGCGLTGGQLRKLSAAGINHIQVSLNGSTQAVHSRSREGFRESMDALQLLSRSGLSFGVNWVARRDNLDDFPETAALAGSLGADNINILRYKPSPTEQYEQTALSGEEFYRLAGMIRQVRGLTVKTDSAYSSLLVHLNHGRVSTNSCGCGAGTTFVAVTAAGDFKPCSHLRLTHRAGSIREYLDSRPLREFLATPVSGGDCGRCNYLVVCGGCRAICHSITGDMFAGETNCPAFHMDRNHTNQNKENTYV